MTRARDRRRFGPGPYLLGLRRDLARWGEGFPFDLPVVAGVEALRLDAPVTLLAGDNGAVRLTRGFLEAPERYLRAALE